MAIQMRRGNSADFDASRMKAGEFAVCLDNGYVYMTLSQGNVIRLGTADSMDEAIALCEEYAKDSEAWANGKKDGVDVPNTDPAYHNNSKYYKDVAQGIVDNFADKIPTASVSRTSGANYVVIRIHDQYGDTVENVYDGADGQDGQDGRDGADGRDGITPDISATATVDGNTGTPSVNVTTTGSISTPVINFAFSNLKGAQGQAGAAGRGVTDIEMGGTGREHPITVTYSDGTTDNIGSIYDGESGTGTGDMLKSTYDVDDNGYVDYAEAITDGVNSLDYDDIVAGLGGGNAEELVRDTVGWTGKNLLNIPSSAVSQEAAGITCTINRGENGEVISIVLNGTCTNGTSFDLIPWTYHLYDEGDYILSDEAGMPYPNGAYTVLNRKKGASGTASEWNTGVSDGSHSKSLTIDYSEYDYFRCIMYVPTGVTCNNLVFRPMLRYADISDSTYEPYHETVKQTLRDAEVIEGKNLLHIPESVVTQEINDVVFTVNRNASGEVTSIVANGTASANATLYLMRYSNLSKYNGCIMTGCPASGGDSSYFMLIQQNGSPYTEYARDNGSGVTVTNVPDSDTTQLFIRIVSDYTANNLTFYPMLRYATEEDATYEPYYTPLKESKFDRAEQRVLGAKNLLENTIETQTINDVVFTVYADGSIKVNGTASANVTLWLHDYITLDAGDYILSGIQNTTDAFCLQLYARNGAERYDQPRIFGFQNDGLGTLTAGNYNVRVYIASGTSVNNVMIYPMLRLASDPDNTYAPYAMTNKQLTDSVNGKIDNPSTKSNGQVLTYNGSSWVAQTPSGGSTSWSSVTSKPFSTVDTTSSGGLTISNDTLDAKVKSVSVASSGTAYWNDAIEQQVLVNGTDSYTIEGTTYMETGSYTDLSGGIREFHFVNNTFITTSKAYTCYCDVLGALPTDIVITSGDAKVKFRTSDNVSRCRLYIR